MNRQWIVLLTGAAALILFAAGGTMYTRQTPKAVSAAQESNQLVRAHSPILGPVNAPVTIVEFFDPSCESCRAFYPVVKHIMEQHPNDVRLVLRYAPFHRGSDEAVKIIEAARLQNMMLPVLEALLETQPVWASHGAPNLAKAWEAAGRAGLDVDRARKDATRPEFDALLRQDLADIKALGVKGTPTFFVNGKPLPSFGREQLAALVQSEVASSKRGSRK